MTQEDTDGDFLTDGEEVHARYGYVTDPTKADSDGDGIIDYLEERGTYGYVTDPNRVDTDGDGLSDQDEYFTYYTNPTLTDTDGGGVSDGDEVHHSESVTMDPRSASDDYLLLDADRDGLDGFAEGQAGTDED